MSLLKKKTCYLQVALNSTLEDARTVISALPPSDRILIEAGTPLIKEYGTGAIKELKALWGQKLLLTRSINPYVVADLKCMDRGDTEGMLAASAGASAAVVLGSAPTETINSFIATCDKMDIDSMVDMMNVEKPYQVLRKLKSLPTIAMLHRGVDEEHFSDKPLPIHMINKVKGAFDIMISIAGGDKPREIQSAVFNGADIVVLWKDFYSRSGNAALIAEEFLRQNK